LCLGYYSFNLSETILVEGKMFELPEYTIIARQINATMTCKTIRRGTLGNSPHKFVWYNRTHEEFAKLIAGQTVGTAYPLGRWMVIPMEPDYTLVLGECGGKILYHPAGSVIPGKYHLYLEFTDGSFFTVTTQMWGGIELHEKGKELESKYIKGMKPTPLDDEFSFEYFSNLINTILERGKQSVKGLLTQNQDIPGLGNAIAQDIMVNAGLHPKHSIADLTEVERKKLHQTIIDTVHEVINQNGRNDEFDLFGNPGGYIRKMDKNTAGQPCPFCKNIIQKIQYLGGAAYFCANCQK